MRVTLVAGMAQQGKTTLALKIARARGRRLLVLDPAKSKALESVRGVTSWPDLARFLTTESGRWEVALRTRHFNQYVAALQAAPFYRHVTMLVDEALTFTTDRESLEALVVIARTSAHFGDGTGLDLVLTAQRPKDIPTDIRSQVTGLYSFCQREPSDLDWMSKFASPDFAEEVAGLPPHRFTSFPPTQEVEDEGVLHGDAGSRHVAGGVPGGPEAQPDPSHSPDSRPQVGEGNERRHNAA